MTPGVVAAPPRVHRPAAAPEQPAPRRARWDGGDWPRTTRVLPWSIAAFVFMLFLIPFAGVKVPIELPIDAKLDRFAIGGLALVWLAAVLSRPEHRPRHRSTLIDLAVGAFVLAAIASVLIGAERIAMADELELAIKKLALLLSFVGFFYIVATGLRPAELGAFAIYIVALSAVLAVGIVWEYRMRSNLFFEWTAKLLPPGFEIAQENPDPRWGRRSITGPTGHGLAASAVLAMALPYAVMLLIAAKKRSRRILYGLAIGLIMAAAMSTLRKTAVFAPATALLVLSAYRPKAMVRLIPLGIVCVLVIQGLAPGALASISDQIRPSKLSSAGTVKDRVADFDAVAPDVAAHPVIGRGYGTYDHNKYRLLDNQYLGLRISVGYIGIAAYIAIFLSAVAIAHRLIRARRGFNSEVALAGSAACVVFGVGSALFDIMAFPHAPYVFLLSVALIAVAARGAATERMSARQGSPAVARY